MTRAIKSNIPILSKCNADKQQQQQQRRLQLTTRRKGKTTAEDCNQLKQPKE